MKRKTIIPTFVLVVMVLFFFPISSLADNMDGMAPEDLISQKKQNENSEDIREKNALKIVVVEPTNSSSELFRRYEGNSFRIMTKGSDALSPLKKSTANMSTGLKEFSWGLTMYLGKFNVVLTKFLFSFDMVEPIKDAMAQFTTALSKNIGSIASTVGIVFVGIMMVGKYMKEQRLGSAIRVFLVTCGMFLMITLFSDVGRTKNVMDTFFTFDGAVETEFVKVNPTLHGDEIPDNIINNVPQPEESSQQTAAKLLAAKVFKSNVYNPYLLLQYGTTDTNKIRNRTIKLENVEYDRIGILLDNDFGDAASEKIESQVIDYETEEIKNKNISYTNNLGNVFTTLFFGVANFVQTIVLIIMAVIRALLQFLQVVMFPLSLLLLLFAMFVWIESMVTRIIKVMGILVFAKALCSFMVLFYASFVSLGYTAIEGIDSVFGKIITLILYVLTPLAFYWLRYFFMGLLTGSSGFTTLMLYARHPRKSYKNDQAKAEKKNAKKEERRRKEAERKKEEDKKKRESNEPQDDNLRQVPKEQTTSGQETEASESARRKEQGHGEQSEQNESGEESKGGDNIPSDTNTRAVNRRESKASETGKRPGRNGSSQSSSEKESSSSPGHQPTSLRRERKSSDNEPNTRRSPQRSQSGVKNAGEARQKLPPKAPETTATVRENPKATRASVHSTALHSPDNSKVFRAVPSGTLQRKSAVNRTRQTSKANTKAGNKPQAGSKSHANRPSKTGTRKVKPAHSTQSNVKQPNQNRTKREPINKNLINDGTKKPSVNKNLLKEGRDD